MSMRGVYTQAVRKQLAGYFGNWEPTAPISLGDYGFQVGAAFERLGSVGSFGVSFALKAGPSGQTHQKFTSSKAVKAELGARGEAASARASLKVDFHAGSAVFADFSGCSFHAVEDKRRLGEQLLENDLFDRRWVVVTDLLMARRSIIAISSSSQASITFEADAPLSSAGLADADIGFKAERQADIGYLIAAERDLTPLIGLCGFRSRFLSPETDFRTRSASSRGTPAVQPEISDPVFLQLS